MCSSTLQDCMAQHYLECDVCETGPAQYYCHTCAGKMCETCTEDHRRKKMFQNHSITQLKSTIKQTNLCCSDHRTKHCELYCKTCENPICVECITETHKGHEVEKLSTFFGERREILSKYIDRVVRIVIPAHENLLTETKTSHEEVIKSAEETCTSVQRHTENVVRAVKSTESEILVALMKSKKQALTSIQSNQSIVNNRIARLKEIKKTLQEMYDSNSADDSLLKQQISSIEEMEKLFEITVVTPSKFAPGKLDSSLIKYQFGNLTSFGLSKTQRLGIYEPSDPPPFVHSNKKLMEKPVKKNLWTTDAEKQFGIRCMNATTALVHGNDNQIRVVDVSGKVSKISTNLPSDVWPRGISPTKDSIIYYDNINRKVMRVSMSGDLSTLFTLRIDYFPVKLFVTHLGNILITLALKKSGKDEGQRGKVVEYNTSGQIVKEFITYKGKELFKRPVFVANNPVNGDILVSERYTKKIIVLNGIGNLKFEYDGKALSKSVEFCPEQITFDSLCQILIADSGSNAIHFISQDGDPLRLLLTGELDQPVGVCFDGVDLIWIVEYASKKVKIYKYLE